MVIITTAKVSLKSASSSSASKGVNASSKKVGNANVEAHGNEDSEMATIEVLETRFGLAKALLGKFKGEDSHGDDLSNEANEPLLTSSSSSSSSSLSAPNRQLFVMFTGNPGMVHFYTSVANLLVQAAAEGKMGLPWEQAEKRKGDGKSDDKKEETIASAAAGASSSVQLDVLVLGYAGHSTVELNKDRTFVLKQQEVMAVNAMTRIVKNINKWNEKKKGGEAMSREGFSYKRLYIGGHSIGAHVTTVVTDAILSLSRDAFDSLLCRSFLLAPTLCYMRDSPEGKSKAPLLLGKYTNTKVTLATHLTNTLQCLIPKPILKWIIETGEPKTTGEPNASEAVYSILRRNNLRNVLVMARSELEEVYELDCHRLDRIRSKIVAWFPKDDHWSPLSPCYHEIAAALGAVSYPSQIIFDREGVAQRKAYGSEGNKGAAVASSSASLSPVVAVDSSDGFVHAWCLDYNETVVRRMIMPYCLV